MPSNYGGMSKLAMSKKLDSLEFTLATFKIENEDLKAQNAALRAERAAMKVAMYSKSTYDPVTAYFKVPKYLFEEWLP